MSSGEAYGEPVVAQREGNGGTVVSQGYCAAIAIQWISVLAAMAMTSAETWVRVPPITRRASI